MSQLNPLTGSIVQAPQVQQNLAAEKSRQMRQAQELRRGGAPQDEGDQPQIASAEEVDPLSDRANENQPRRQRKPSQQQNPSDSDSAEGLDLKA